MYDHVLSSCIVVMVHVVKGRLYSAYTVPPQSQRWSLRPTLDLDSDKFRCFNHRDEFDSAVQLPNKGRSWHAALYAIYSTSLALSMGLHKPRKKHVEFSQQELSEKVARSL